MASITSVLSATGANNQAKSKDEKSSKPKKEKSSKSKGNNSSRDNSNANLDSSNSNGADSNSSDSCDDLWRSGKTFFLTSSLPDQLVVRCGQ